MLAVRKLKNGRACGSDEILAEFWQEMMDANGTGTDALTELVQQCWNGKCVPEGWRFSKVALIYKKGSAEDCNNYRPISLVNIAYKVYAIVLLGRLKRAGAEERLWPSQFGFRRGASTTHALHVVRRRLEAAWAHRCGSLLLVALDWSKAFDSISPERLVKALIRFGVPHQMIEAIQNIYSTRVFAVTECGQTSNTLRQDFGISQGCPLSPFLFVIVMTVLMRDATCQLDPDALAAYQAGELSDVVFTDDTLIMGVNAPFVEQFIAAIERTGREYGLSLHWGKVQLVKVRNNATVAAPDGKPFDPVDSMVYLGSLVHKDGRASAELSRRIGMCGALFRLARQIWAHTYISMQRKLQIFNALITSKLLYGLTAIWLGIAQQRKLDGFHCRCLRRIGKIPPAFISRISKASVLAKFKQEPLSTTIVNNQLSFLHKVAASPASCPLRKVTFHRKGLVPLTAAYVRRVGRPRHTWAEQLLSKRYI